MLVINASTSSVHKWLHLRYDYTYGIDCSNHPALNVMKKWIEKGFLADWPAEGNILKFNWSA
jgi:hypothetical protein